MKKNLFYIFLVHVCGFSMSYEDQLDMKRFSIYPSTGQTLLHAAVKNPNNKDKVERFLKEGVKVNSKDADGERPLHEAVKVKDNNIIIELLLKNNAKIEAKDKYGQTPLFKAVWWRRNNIGVTQLLLENNANVQAVDTPGMTPLHYAVKEPDNSQIVELLIKKNAEINAKNNEGTTPLHNAVQLPSNKAVVESLLKYRANTNALNEHGETPLHVAVIVKNNNIIIELLLENNAQIEAKDKYGQTPLFKAVWLRSNNIGVTQLLLENNANVQAVSTSGMTPLHYAINEPDNSQIVELLIKKNADIGAENDKGETPLHCAAKIRDNKNVIELLLRNGANANAKNTFHEIPLFNAVSQRDNIDTIRLLLDASDYSAEIHKTCSELVRDNCKYEITGKEGYENYQQLLEEKYQPINNEKLLIEHCNNGNQKEVENLLQKGTNINAQNDLGETGLHRACKNGDLDMVHFLLSNNASTAIFNEKEETPLMAAINNNKVSVVKAIISRKGLDKDWLGNFLHAYALALDQITSCFLEYFYENSDSLQISTIININDLKRAYIDKNIIDKFIFMKDGITLKNIGTIPLYATMSEQLLNLGKTTKKYDTEVRFNLIESNIYEVTFNTGKTKKTMYLKAHADNLGKINRFEFFEKQKNNSFKIKKSSAYNEDVTHIKQKKGMVKNPNVSLFQDDFKVTYSEDFNDLIISFKNPKDGTFTISKSKKNEISITLTPASKAGDKKPTNNEAQHPLTSQSEPQLLFKAADIQGHYVGAKDNIQYQAYIPLFNDGNVIDIDIISTQNNQQTTGILKALPQSASLSKVLYTSLKPAVITKEGLYKSLADGQQITFNGQVWTQRKTKNKLKPLCFTGPIKLDLKSKQLILSTSRGEITLIHNTFVEEPQEIIEEMGADEVNQDLAIHDPNIIDDEDYNGDTITHSYALDSDDGSSDEELADEVIETPHAVKKVKRKQISKRLKNYVELKELDSPSYEESIEKIVNRSWPKLQEKITKEDDEKPKAPSLVQMEVLRPIKLNPNSSLDDCSLYNNEDPSKSIWFGEARNKKIVINLGNFNQGFERFAQGASWCSFYDSTLGEKNRLNGINAHCSYHRHEEKEYIYISNHGLFLIDKDNQGFTYLIKLPDQKNKNSIEYRLTKSFDKTAYDSYNHLKLTKNHHKILDDIIKTENLFHKAQDVRKNLSKLGNLIEITYGNRTLKFSPRENGSLYYKNKIWRNVMSWDMQMINLNRAFIYIVFINNKNLPQTLSFKIDVDQKAEFIRVIQKSYK